MEGSIVLSGSKVKDGGAPKFGGIQGKGSDPPPKRAGLFLALVGGGGGGGGGWGGGWGGGGGGRGGVEGWDL